MDNLLPAIAIGLLIFLVAREIMCWYWRIHERVNNQEKQIELLEKILFNLEQMNAPQEPEDEFIDEESTP